MVLAFVGSGGKTTAIFTLAERLRRLGRRVLVTTTTHMQNPCNPNARRRALPLCQERYCCLNGDIREILARLKADGYCQAGLPVDGKMGPLPDPVYQAACAGAEVVLVEADGSRTLPLKYPAEYEPVIPGNTDEIFVLCGLSALGRPLSQVTHRLALALEALNEEPGVPHVSPDSQADPVLIYWLYYKGYLQPLRQRFPGIAVRLLPSQAVTLYQRCAAALLSAKLDPSLLREEWFSSLPDGLRRLESQPGLQGAFALALDQSGPAHIRPGSLLVLEPGGSRIGTLGGGVWERWVWGLLEEILAARQAADLDFPPAFPPPAAKIITCDVPTGDGTGRVKLLLGDL